LASKESVEPTCHGAMLPSTSVVASGFEGRDWRVTVTLVATGHKGRRGALPSPRNVEGERIFGDSAQGSGRPAICL
jgi:hypothetical protein